MGSDRKHARRIYTMGHANASTEFRGRPSDLETREKAALAMCATNQVEETFRGIMLLHPGAKTWASEMNSCIIFHALIHAP